MNPLQVPSWQLRVLGPGDEVVGGAFLLSPNLAVTCAHVVISAMGYDKETVFHDAPRVTVRLLARDGRTYETEVDARIWSCGPYSRDLAVLRPEPSVLGSVDLPVLLETAPREANAPLHLLGYPADAGSMWLSLAYRGEAGPSPGSHQVEIAAGSSVHITDGFSGCAVRDETGAVVGMMQKTHFYGWGEQDKPSGIGFFLPISEMVGRRDKGSDSERHVTVRRLTDESVCGPETYDLLHDSLHAMPVEDLVWEDFLSHDELERLRGHHRPVASAWEVLMAVWDFYPRSGRPPVHLAWVHHVFREVNRLRPITPAVWAWVAVTGPRLLGSSWEEDLVADRARRLEQGSGSGAGGGSSPEDTPVADQPEVMAIFHLEQVARGYRMSFSMAYRSGAGGYDLRPQESEVLQRAGICDRISDTVREARSRSLISVDAERVGLRIIVPRALVNLRLGQTAVSRGTLHHPARLAGRYEIIFHVRERIESADYLDADPSLWRRRTQLQHQSPSIRHQNVFFSWQLPVDEVADRLSDAGVTICAVDSDGENHSDVLDSVLHQGVPTVIQGPREAVRSIVEELLVKEPDSRVPVGSLAGYLRERYAHERAAGEISLIHDLYGDELALRVLDLGEL